MNSHDEHEDSRPSHERRHYPKPSLKETLVLTKEIPIAWLATFVCGGLFNLAAIIWIAATLVGTVRVHDSDLLLLKTQALVEMTLNATQTERINAIERTVSDNKRELEILIERVNKLNERRDR